MASRDLGSDLTYPDGVDPWPAVLCAIERVFLRLATDYGLRGIELGLDRITCRGGSVGAGRHDRA